ncbi:uncharacterized protein N7459_005912 [Penicillium hispanicum]|uniref:uncharacterized protein n=1 Tax=Penicillium hispanicum TaxID=1080232 RepID=UPI0025416DC5|nr:uncharacterized protein N7459_005912 [Penicillium hispanicum]KAJ5579927.1 hypothetical protein N7459_005912 [Penicillium hispanicum]
MMRPRDPRIRQRINQISHNLESANESAQEGLYTFSQNYVSPCLAAVGNCVSVCTAPCLPSREDHLRRRRRGRAEANFDFYDDWDNEEAEDSLLGWGTGELDRLLAGSGLTRPSAEQPRRPRKMSYGTRNPRRRSTVHIPDNRSDPTVIPSSSLLGFLERFPWRFGAKGVKYRPSAADLQEHPGSTRRDAHEDEPLMEATDDEEGRLSHSRNGRNRSATESSRGTSNSLSSRGDLFPSDEEDAVPLDDEFALTFGRRGTGLESDDQSGSKSGIVRSASGTSSLDVTSKKSKQKKKRSSTKSPRSTDQEIVQNIDTPSLADLKMEEDRAAREEESTIERKRLAAQELASKRGLDQFTTDASATPFLLNNPKIRQSPNQGPFSHGGNQVNEPVEDNGRRSSASSIRLSSERTEPFPPFPVPGSETPSRPNSLNGLSSGLDPADEPIPPQ